MGIAERVLRYSAVSVVAVGVTQSVLYVGYALIGLPAALANVLAVCLAAWPAYVLNRRWVWIKRDTHSLTREIVPFWAYNLAGLLFSTILVAVVTRSWDAAWVVHAANISAFGVLWLGKFILLDRVLFVVHARADAP